MSLKLTKQSKNNQIAEIATGILVFQWLAKFNGDLRNIFNRRRLIYHIPKQNFYNILWKHEIKNIASSQEKL